MTHTVYENPACRVDDTDGVRSVVATVPIERGTVLLIEHALHGDLNFLANCILNDPALYDSLHPRGAARWSIEGLASGALEDSVLEKVDANGFVFLSAESTVHDGAVSLGRTVSNFNHASPPLAIVNSFSLAIDSLEGVPPPRLIYVLASADISPGSEITISYRSEPSAMHPYVEQGSGPRPEDSEAERAGAERARGLAIDYVGEQTDFVAVCFAHEKARTALRQLEEDESPSGAEAVEASASAPAEMAPEMTPSSESMAAEAADAAFAEMEAMLTGDLKRSLEDMEAE